MLDVQVLGHSRYSIPFCFTEIPLLYRSTNLSQFPYFPSYAGGHVSAGTAIYLLYWYISTNTDAARGADKLVEASGMFKYQHGSVGTRFYYVVTCPRVACPFDCEQQESDYPAQYYLEMIKLGWSLMRYTNDFSRGLRGLLGREEGGHPAKFKCCISCGAVAGIVLGSLGCRPVYCLYGNSLSVAARMSAHANTERVCVSADFARRLRVDLRVDPSRPDSSDISLISRGTHQVKGMGSMELFDVAVLMSPGELEAGIAAREGNGEGGGSRGCHALGGGPSPEEAGTTIEEKPLACRESDLESSAQVLDPQYCGSRERQERERERKREKRPVHPAPPYAQTEIDPQHCSSSFDPLTKRRPRAQHLEEREGGRERASEAERGRRSSSSASLEFVEEVGTAPRAREREERESVRERGGVGGGGGGQRERERKRTASCTSCPSLRANRHECMSKSVSQEDLRLRVDSGGLRVDSVDSQTLMSIMNRYSLSLLA
jgi:hypothetical protein